MTESGLDASNHPLAELRREIDTIDAEMIALLARRFACLDRVIAVKRREGLPAAIIERVEEVVANVRAAAEKQGTPPDFAEAAWRTIIEWSIAYEHARLDRPPLSLSATPSPEGER
jgi:isochorismate pyruvate lyase